jgi:hypothetical protein
MVIYLFYLVLALMLSLVLFCLFCLCFLLCSSFLALIIVLCEIHIQGQPPDWEDFLRILFLLIVNSTISFIEENNVGNAAYRNPTLAKCRGEAQHLEKLGIWSPPGLPNIQSSTARPNTPCVGVFLVSLERS